MSARRTSHPRTALVALLLLVASALAGCTTLPESGPVHRQAVDPSEQPLDAPYFNPPGPAKDGSPAAIVSGFLVAMQANPLSTSVAREFLSERAKTTWKPNRGTIVYEASTVLPTRTGATVRLADTRRLDARGGWRGSSPGRSEDLDISLVSEGGQWRVDNPVNALVVPTPFFDRSFERFNLYFFDQTGRVLLPDPVFIPRGQQTATNLVRGLLAGPGATIGEISRSALPVRTDLDLSVVVTGSGVAEVPLSRELLQASPAEISRAVDQLAWTLRQVPDIERVRITVDGAPVPLPGGRIDAPVTSGSELDAAGTSESALWGPRPPTPESTVRSVDPATPCAAWPSARRHAGSPPSRATAPPSSSRPHREGRPPPRSRVPFSMARTCCGRRTTCSVTCGWWTAPTVVPGCCWSAVTRRARCRFPASPGPTSRRSRSRATGAALPWRTTGARHRRSG
jgi:hypothetical protein